MNKRLLTISTICWKKTQAKILEDLEGVVWVQSILKPGEEILELGKLVDSAKSLEKREVESKPPSSKT